MSAKKPKIPQDEAEWDQIEEDFALGADHRMLLTLGRQAWDRWQRIRNQIDADGELVAGRYEGSSRAHPLLSAEVLARNAVIRVLQVLDLPDGPGSSEAELFEQEIERLMSE